MTTKTKRAAALGGSMGFSLGAAALLIWEATISAYGVWTVLGVYAMVGVGALLIRRQSADDRLGPMLFAYFMAVATAMAVHVTSSQFAAAAFA